MRTTRTPLLTTLYLAGCGSIWVDREGCESAVFSDDGVGMAALYRVYKEKVGPLANTRSTISIQLVVKDNLDSTLPVAITDPLEGIFGCEA